MSYLYRTAGELIGTTAGNGNVVRIDQRGEYQVSLKYFQQDHGIQLAIRKGSWLSGRVDVTQNGDKKLLSANQSGAVGWWGGNTQGNNNQTEITQYGESYRCEYTSGKPARYI